jgi:hypothetical protein
MNDAERVEVSCAKAAKAIYTGESENAIKQALMLVATAAQVAAIGSVKSAWDNTRRHFNG